VQHAQLDAGALGCLRGGVAGTSADHALGGEEHHRAGGSRAPQLGERDPVGGEPLEQREAVGALLSLESQTMIVLGIDPGLASTGYGVIATDRTATGEQRLLALGAGVIRTGASAATETRLAEIHAEVDGLLLEHAPDAVALEELYFGQNARTAFAVGQGRGAAMLAAGQRGVPCASYTPQQVKSAVCGSGRAGKDQVCRMVMMLLGLAQKPPSDHAADALAVAVCHANCAPRARALAGVGL